MVTGDGSFDRVTMLSGWAALQGDTEGLELVMNGGTLDYEGATGVPASVQLLGGTLNVVTTLAAAKASS